ncbi:MAG TPA: GNAT family N-acetyltransferase, partial [Edaphobacter sp.]
MGTTATDRQEIVVREILPKDAEAVAELSGQLGYAATASEVKDRIEGMLPLQSNHLVLVACNGDETIGWIEAETVHHLQSPAHTLITGLVVSEGARSLGIGKRLCLEVERWSLGRGVPI